MRYEVISKAVVKVVDIMGDRAGQLEMELFTERNGNGTMVHYVKETTS